MLLPSDPSEARRGLLDLRGLIHAHSPFSHDACDGEPLIDGLPDPVCMADLRRGLCQVQHDFAMFTDHDDSGSDTAYVDLRYQQTSLHLRRSRETLAELSRLNAHMGEEEASIKLLMQGLESDNSLPDLPMPRA